MNKIIWILINTTILIMLTQTASALNTFYTTQSSNATFEISVAESDLTSGLVGYWSFNSADKSNATNATDKSGLQNHGTVTGATFTNEGRFKEGYKFDGSDDRVNAGNAISLNLSKNITISSWIKIASANVAGYPMIVTKGVNTGYILYVNVDGLPRFAIGSTGTPANYVTGTTDISANVGKWYHVVGTYNKSTLVMYVNGVREATTANTVDILTNAFSVMIGTSETGTTLEWNGSIDEVRIYNRSLSASEVAALYNGTKSTHLTLKTEPTLGILNTTADLVGYWTFDSRDKSNATNATDKSGLQNHGTVTGATFTNEGRFKEGYKFDGVDDYTQVSYNSNLNPINFTVSTWAKVAGSQGSWRSLITSRDTITGVLYGYIIYATNINDWEFWVGNGTSWRISKGNPVVLNQWVHLVAVHNSSNMLFYHNGNLVNISEYNYSRNTQRPLRIGAGTTESTPNFYFNGTIDEVRIYNRSLSASEVAALYNGTKSTHLTLKADPTLGILNTTADLVGYWTFDSKDGSNASNATDKSGLQNHGTVTGATFTNEGRFREGYKFDGVDDYVSVGNAQSLNLSANFAISAWIYPKLISGTVQNVYGMQDDIFGVYDSGGKKVYFQKGGGSFETITSSANSVDINQWYHIAVSKGGTASGDTKIYINGVQNDNAIAIPNLLTTNISSYIGSQTGTTRFFNGTIDEVRIYNRSLTASEVAGLYNGTKSTHLKLFSTVG